MIVVLKCFVCLFVLNRTRTVLLKNHNSILPPYHQGLLRPSKNVNLPFCGFIIKKKCVEEIWGICYSRTTEQ